MATYDYTPGLGKVGAYQVSGKPYVEGPLEGRAAAGGGPHVIQFPSVTRWVKLTNTDGGGAELLVGFSANGLTNQTNAFAVPDGQTMHLELKVTEFYYTGSCSSFGVIAGLTGIPTSTIENNWSGSSGIG